MPLVYADNAECGRIEDYVYEDGKSNVIVANRNAGKQVALTFDDGPSGNYTPMILDILAENGVKGTFFVVGRNAERYPMILKRIHSEGHEIGNHTYSHPDMKKLTPEQLDEEISRTGKAVSDIVGVSPVLFRPPGGYLSNDIVDKITSNSCKTVLWSWRQDTMDWKCPDVEKVVETVLSNIRDGDIILFHDFNPGKSPTPEALKIIIPELLGRGYEFVTVSELVNM
ncbi:MAG: polysaccharide deacetylase family protein [Clostridia bacterium]|nr:polysaccharide deacetylase family protein [Clostridia bacterium]